MAGYDQKIKIKVAYQIPARDFFAFLQSVGRKYTRPVKINYRYLGRGYFYVTIDGGPGGIDALFQELLLNRGLYYYACSIRGEKRKEVISNAITPIFQQLLEARFQYPHSRFLRRHILGKVSQEKLIPGDFKDSYSHEYEILFRKWDIGIINDWNFIKDLDSLLTQFLLTRINHIPGQHSPTFPRLVEIAQKKGIGMMDEVKDKFNEVHKERTLGLHRLQTSLNKEQISQLSFWLFNYFQFFDEFKESQKMKTERLHGKRYRRVKYGDELWLDENNEPYKDENGIPYDQKESAKRPCHDCAAISGQLHCQGCDVEQCPRCREQFISCKCKLMKDYEDPDREETVWYKKENI